MSLKSIGKANLSSTSLQTPPAKLITCDRAHSTYDICKINGPTVLDPTTATFYAMDPKGSTVVEKIRPYPRKLEAQIMPGINEVILTSGPSSPPPCQVQHNAPALVFSAGGYTGNFFHEFNDGFIPLYITVNTIFSEDEEVVLVISKARHWWVSKYAELLKSFSKHPIVNLDNDTSTHCFASASVGLISHGFMTVDPTRKPNPKSMTHFRAFLGKAYTHHQEPSETTRPRLVLVTRNGAVGRVLLNQDEVKKEAEGVGFDVVVFEPKPSTPLRLAYELMNSSHAMVGVHGAGLTHALFLRSGSVFVQVVPLGTEWVAEACFGRPAKAMGLEYMEYRIEAEESSLVDEHGKDEMVIKDPGRFRGKGWSPEVMDLYLKKQNVRVDTVRFRGYLKEAYEKSIKLLDLHGERV